MTKKFGIVQNEGQISNLEKLLELGTIQAYKDAEEKREALFLLSIATGGVSNSSFLSLDGGRWDETYINSIPYDGGTW